MRTIWKQINAYPFRSYRAMKNMKRTKFAYEHPDVIRRYLQDGPCKKCQAADTCEVPCGAYWRWWDARLLTVKNIEAVKRIKIKEIHFAWDLMKNSKRIIKGLNLWKRYGKKNKHGSWGTVYVLVNFNTTMAENLYRIYTLDKMGFDPYVMIYDKPHAPREIRLLQRWCNNKKIFRSCPKFEDYDPKQG